MDPPEFDGATPLEWFRWLWQYRRHRILDYVAPRCLLDCRQMTAEYKIMLRKKKSAWMSVAYPTVDAYITHRLYYTMSDWGYDPHVLAGSARFKRDYTHETGLK